MTKDIKTMRKNIIIAALIVAVVVLMGLTLYLNKRVQVADAYISVLESDYPDYIDTTSGTDEFWEYYNNK